MDSVLKIHCRLRVAEVSRLIDQNGQVSSERVQLIAVYGEEGIENAQWSQYTPSTSFQITIYNPQAFGALTKDHEYIVHFVPAST